MNKKLAYLSSVPLLGLALSSPPVLAADWTERTSVSGFYSARYSQTDEEAYFHGDRETGINEDGSFQGTKLGLTVTTQVNDDLSVAALLMSAADENDFSTHVDWAFASFRLNDAFTLRAGKIKFPVGLVNEYVDVGATYPWISAPQLIYTDETAGPQATREAYTGTSLLWESDIGDGDWSVGSDLFFGQVNLEGMTVKGLFGLTVRANWDDSVEFQVSTYEGTMHTDPTAMGMMALMNQKKHSATLFGIKVDWNDIVAYVEAAKVEMDVTMMGKQVGDSDAWYATLGYRIGKFLPHITRQEWDRDNGNNQRISTLGVAYSLTDSVVIKAEQSRIETDDFATQAGLFDVSPSSDSVDMTSIAVDVIF
ncbi:MAG: porin [Gammaproteobacteria bacterium]|nr:porin [Gammaproteobacteria bacterium]